MSRVIRMAVFLFVAGFVIWAYAVMSIIFMVFYVPLGLLGLPLWILESIVTRRPLSVYLSEYLSYFRDWITLKWLRHYIGVAWKDLIGGGQS